MLIVPLTAVFVVLVFSTSVYLQGDKTIKTVADMQVKLSALMISRFYWSLRDARYWEMMRVWSESEELSKNYLKGTKRHRQRKTDVRGVSL
jgi:hypothetical protein